MSVYQLFVLVYALTMFKIVSFRHTYWACLLTLTAVADPRFPVEGRRSRRGGADSRGGYVLKILYVEMKESGP